MFEVPNLDAFSHDPADQKEAARVLRILADYCDNRAVSIEARLEGRIDIALKNEAVNEHRYRSLPAWARR